jgi:RNA polymerase sigma-70 factor (ECF subfamily)
MARLRNSIDADEVLQDVAFVAWRKRDQLQDESRIEPWLYRIAIRQVLMFWRKRKRGARDVAINADMELPPDDRLPNPAVWVTRQEAHDMVRQSVKRLSPQDREILLLKHVEGWTYQQISERLRLTQDKVIYRVSRARGRLRKQLAALDFQSETGQENEI